MDRDKEQLKTQICKALEEEPMKETIQRASLFGSYLHGTPTQESDIDLLIEFKPTARIGLFEFVEIQRRLAERLGRKVDLLTPEALSKYFREQVLREAELIYER